MPGEVITIQAGNFANYVGAHFWNFQVRSYSRSVLCHACNAPSESNVVYCPQEELLGLAEQDGTAALARQIDAQVLFREGETAQVKCHAMRETKFTLKYWYQVDDGFTSMHGYAGRSHVHTACGHL